MKIDITNIGKIRKASIDIAGITVIAGENDTGKSTVGKTLFTVFNSFYNIEKIIEKQRKQLVKNKIDDFMYDGTFFIDRRRILEIKKRIIEKIIRLEKNIINRDNIIGIISSVIGESNIENVLMNEEVIREKSSEIAEIMNLENKFIFMNSLNNNLHEEFNGQVQNLYNSEAQSKIVLEISKEKTEIIIENQEVKSIDKEVNLSTRAIYIDDPFVLDKMSQYFNFGITYQENINFYEHKEFLARLLKSPKLTEKNIVSATLLKSRMESVLGKLESVFHGSKIMNDGIEFSYELDGIREKLDMKNLSTGIKTFAILKLLIEKGILEQKGTIILDEPEIHLHPEWQLIFAEIIVILQKQLGLHVLITTHSPYFLRAIQVYAGKYEIADKCKYYLANNEDDYSAIKDVSDNIEAIYRKLSLPFQKLEDELHENC